MVPNILRPALILLLVGFLLPAGLLAEKPIPEGTNSENLRSIRMANYPVLRAGSHVNSFGYVIHPSWTFLSTARADLTIGVESMLKINASKLGIPGGATSAINRFSLTYDYRSSGLNAQAGSFGLYYIHYASTDLTNQSSAGFRYGHSFPATSIQVQYENDLFMLQGYDQFRTSGLSFDLFRKVGNRMVGIGIENLLWTGTTSGLRKLNAGEIYPMEGQFGANYSHGVLATRFHLGNFSLKVGYDADVIRSGIQDRVHTLVNDGIIPRGSMSRDRLFIQFSLNTSGWLY